MMIAKDYNTFDEFMQDLIDIYIDDENFTVLCDDRTASKIIKKFLSFDDKTTPYIIDVEDAEYGGYVDEYFVSNLGTELFCEKARRNGKPVACGAGEIMFVQKDFVGKKPKDFIENNCIPNLYFGFAIKEY